MILHASFTAENPRRTAEMLARILEGEAFPMPQLADGAWLAIAGDGRARAIEILPNGSEFRPEEAGAVIVPSEESPPRSGFHLLIETRLSEKEVASAAAAAMAAFRPASRGPFDLLEVWVDGRTLIEVVTPELAPAYRAVASLSSARASLRASDI